MDDKLEQLQNRLRELAMIARNYRGSFNPDYDVPCILTGYSGATFNIVVCKKAEPQFIQDQAEFMRYLGEDVCPKILAISSDNYNMEYLQPPVQHVKNLLIIETLLQTLVWNRSPTWITIGREEWRTPIRNLLGVEVPDWALGPLCVFHGDPTCDNLLYKNDSIRLTDPIPPKWLKKPSIKAVDHGKMLQSFLGWETILRGLPLLEYEWPVFMQEYESAQRAVFWANIALKRVAYRGYDARISKWAQSVSEGLEKLCT